MSLPRLLSLMAVVFLAAWMLFSKGDKNRFFIKYILLAYPLMSGLVIPGTFAMNAFDLSVYLFTFLFYKRRNVHLKYNGFIYMVLMVIMVLNICIGLFNAEMIGSDVMLEVLDFFPVFIYAKILVDECLDDPSFFYEVIHCLRLTIITSLLFLCCQFVFGVKFALLSVLNPNMTGGVQRYSSFFADPQVYSQYLAVVSFLCLIKKPDEPRLPVMNYVLLVLSLVAIMYTGGRGGFGGWGAGLLVLILFGDKKYRVSALVTCAILGIIVYNFSDNFAIFQRGDALADSYDERYGIWRDAFQIFLDNPFFGIGIGNYSTYVSLHNPDQFWLVGQEVVYFDHPESGYLKYLTELGAVGFIGMFSFILIPIARGFVLFLKRKDISIILMISGLVGWMVAFYTVYSLGDVRMKVLIATLLCLLVTSEKRILTQDAEETV